ncbi:MAG: S-adenosylmethionine:tRNA ribosyltransferase-isomerase [Armatimonadetes bacterium]|nr:S-adenosylmethionine:tRNA ribosyltransferase-isomerase [Armatimonadota bacterium]
MPTPPDHFHYHLPDDRIALRPLAKRDDSKLLVCDVRDTSISHHTFRQLPSLLPNDSLLVLNDTRVVRARIVMRKPTGGRVEFFLLEPVAPSHDPAIALAAHGEATWNCMVGGARRFRPGDCVEGEFLMNGVAARLAATMLGSAPDGFALRFRWQPAGLSFADLLDAAGSVPLPPYIHRTADESDSETYQTVYAQQSGAVAAPTAGLHFTNQTFAQLRQRGIETARVTLHVGAGTFKQVKGEIAEHDMHQEQISITPEALRALIEQGKRQRESECAPFVMVGTTALRTVESLYWFGVRLLRDDGDAWALPQLSVGQWDPYRLAESNPLFPPPDEAFLAVEEWRNRHGVAQASGRTKILIVPGYQFRACDALITNFHQPGSTLILLVGALLGHALWQRVYGAALHEGYRFLSYGDSSLLIRGRFGGMKSVVE